MSKRKINKKLDLVLLFELFKIGKHKTEQCNQIDISLTSIVIGQKSTNQIAQYLVESRHGFCTLLSTLGTFGRPLGDFRRVFRDCRKRHSYKCKDF